jgi:hypothetical protein
MRYITDLTFNAIDASASANGPTIDASQLLQVSAQIIATGSPTGTIKFQASNDFGNSMASTTPTNWTDIATQTITLTTAGSFLIPKFEICYQWIRIVYTSGGTGTITVKMKAHGV